MDIQKVKEFFMWCTIINGALLFLTIIGSIAMPEFVYDIQSTLFNIPRKFLYIIFHGFLGLFKILWLVFNVVPYLALVLVTRK